jgi:hypothetical protein
MDHFEINFLLAVAALCVAALAATSVGAITLAVLALVAYFFGNHKAVAFLSVAVGALLTAWQLISGDLLVAILALWQEYTHTAWPGTIDVWLRAALRPDYWLALCPPSLILGALLLLFYLDYRDSPLRAVTNFAGEAIRSPAPWVRLKLRRRLEATTALTNSALIGLDAATGSRVTLTTDQLRHHTVLVGRSGAGKTTTLCNLLQFCIIVGIPVFFLDGKGDRRLGDRVIQFARRYATTQLTLKENSLI